MLVKTNKPPPLRPPGGPCKLAPRVECLLHHVSARGVGGKLSMFMPNRSRPVRVNAFRHAEACN